MRRKEAGMLKETRLLLLFLQCFNAFGCQVTETVLVSGQQINMAFILKCSLLEQLQEDKSSSTWLTQMHLENGYKPVCPC